LYLTQERKLAAGSLHVAVSGMRALYDWVLRWPNGDLWRALARGRESVPRPQVFDVSEVERLLTVGRAPRKHSSQELIDAGECLVVLIAPVGTFLGLDYRDNVGPTANWETMAVMSRTNASQFYFDLSAPLPPQRFYLAEQMP
jgi:hypothetical protein